MFRGDEDPLGPLLGKLPAEVLRLVLGHLTPFDRALFARASGSCFRACERSGLGRAGVRRGDRSQAVKMTEMVVTPTMFEWTKREAGVDEEKFYCERYRLSDSCDSLFCRLESTVELAATTAAGNGDLEYFKCVLHSFRSTKYASDWQGDEWDALCYAAEHGHFHIIEWALANGFSATADMCAGAAVSGRLDMLKWLRQKGHPWDEDTCACAARYGHLDVLRWARDNGCPWDENTCACTARYGHLDVLRWARDNGCPWDEKTCTFAAVGGHLDVLRWARDNGCPWDENTCVNAAGHGQLDVLRWARDNGCPCPEQYRDE